MISEFSVNEDGTISMECYENDGGMYMEQTFSIENFEELLYNLHDVLDDAIDQRTFHQGLTPQ